MTSHYVLGTFQLVALAISAMTLILTNIELYFLRRESATEKNCCQVFKQNLSVTPFFLFNGVFKILTVSLIFAVSKLWGLINLILMSFAYGTMICCLHDGINRRPTAGMYTQCWKIIYAFSELFADN